MPTDDDSDKVAYWIETHGFDAESNDYDWKDGDDEEIRANLRKWYNSLPEKDKGSRLKGFIESPSSHFGSNSDTLPDGVQKSNDNYIDKIQRIINGKGKVKTVEDVEVDKKYLDETIEIINELKQNRKIELRQEAEIIKSRTTIADRKAFETYQERFSTYLDRRDADALLNLAGDIRDDSDLTESNRDRLLNRIIIALDNIEGR